MHDEQTKRIAKERQDMRRKSASGFMLTSGSDTGADDTTILNFIYEYRLLCARHLVALTGREYTRVQGRLKGLFDHGYIKCRRLPQEQHIYSIARKGLIVLVGEDLVSEKDATARRREQTSPNSS